MKAGHGGVHRISIFSLTQEVEVGGSRSKAGSRQKWEILSEKSTKAQRAEGIVQVAKHLTSKHEALHSNSSTAKKKKNAPLQTRNDP
jgi:hypothetical protein